MINMNECVGRIEAALVAGEPEKARDAFLEYKAARKAGQRPADCGDSHVEGLRYDSRMCWLLMPFDESAQNAITIAVCAALGVRLGDAVIEVTPNTIHVAKYVSEDDMQRAVSQALYTLNIRDSLVLHRDVLQTIAGL